MANEASMKERTESEAGEWRGMGEGGRIGGKR